MNERLMFWEFVKPVLESQGIDPNNVQRVVIDAEFGHPVRIHVQTLATKALLDVIRLDSGAVEVRVLE